MPLRRYDKTAYRTFTHHVITKQCTAGDIIDDIACCYDINCLDKQLARIRMDYISLNGFLHRHGLSDHSSCNGCVCLNGSSIIQSSSHVLLSCPIYAGERKSMLSSIESLFTSPTLLLCSIYLSLALSLQSTLLLLRLFTRPSPTPRLVSFDATSL